MPTISYPLDTQGNSPANLVTETHTVTSINLAMYRIIVPTHAPFYLTNFSLYHIGIGDVRTKLDEGIDFVFCLPYEAAARSLGKKLYGGAAIINSRLSGRYEVTYQCLGDKWSADRNYVLQALAASSYNPRQVYWDQLTNVQEIFPPLPHTDDMSGMKGLEHLIESLDAMTLAVINRPYPTPHMLGLGNVPNLPLATDTDVANRSKVDKFVTLKQVVQMFESLYSE